MRKISRNDPCWCGSGKKYKKCHMSSDLESGRLPGLSVRVPKGVIVKTEEQVNGIRKSCQLAKSILDYVEKKIKVGITTDQINDWVHELTVENNAIPAPLNYNGFPKSVCTSINNVICHGIPDDTVLKDGDIINVDVTTILDGYYGDTSRMFLIGDPSPEARKLVTVAYECLEIGIETVKPYSDISVIGEAIERHATKHGYSVVRDYGGHGVGLKFHEEPHVHHYGYSRKGMLMVPNMTFTIEPMINAGGYSSKLLSDGWTAITSDGSLSAQWEHSIRVTDDGVEIMTA